MKPDDKFLEEMLDDIREQADRAANALDSLYGAIHNMLDVYTCFQSPLMHDWCCRIVNASEDVSYIAARAEELADAEDETEEGGRGMKATDCKHALACHEHDFHDGGADAEQCLVDCELMGDFMEIGSDCGKGHCRLYERREEAGE